MQVEYINEHDFYGSKISAFEKWLSCKADDILEKAEASKTESYNIGVPLDVYPILSKTLLASNRLLTYEIDRSNPNWILLTVYAVPNRRREAIAAAKERRQSGASKN